VRLRETVEWPWLFRFTRRIVATPLAPRCRLSTRRSLRPPRAGRYVRYKPRHSANAANTPVYVKLAPPRCGLRDPVAAHRVRCVHLSLRAPSLLNPCRRAEFTVSDRLRIRLQAIRFAAATCLCTHSEVTQNTVLKYQRGSHCRWEFDETNWGRASDGPESRRCQSTRRNTQPSKHVPFDERPRRARTCSRLVLLHIMLLTIITAPFATTVSRLQLVGSRSGDRARQTSSRQHRDGTHAAQGPQWAFPRCGRRGPSCGSYASLLVVVL